MVKIVMPKMIKIVMILAYILMMTVESQFAGIFTDKSVSELTSAGFTLCYEVTYATSTNTADLTNACGSSSNSMLFVGGRLGFSSTVALGAFALASDVMIITASASEAYYRNGAYWYYKPSSSFGFADSSVISLGSADVATGTYRLSWHLDQNVGGYRVGGVMGLNGDTSYYKVIYRKTLSPTLIPTFKPTTPAPTVAPSSGVSLSYFGTTDVVVPGVSVSSLDSVSILSVILGGGSMGSGSQQKTGSVCPHTAGTSTSTTRSYIFYYGGDSYIKMVLVTMSIQSGSLYVRASLAGYRDQLASYTCVNVNSAWEIRNEGIVAVCISCVSYGVHSLSLGVASVPSQLPTRVPSRAPSLVPSIAPSAVPSVLPSAMPSRSPTSQPSSQPSCQPLGQPSGRPSRQPSGQPSCQPSTQPSGTPSTSPSCHPSGQPLVQPTATPTLCPSSLPSAEPSLQPSTQPSALPSFSGQSFAKLGESLRPLLVRNAYGFAAITNSGGVLTWGSGPEGGDSTSVADLLVGVRSVVASESAFAALKHDGTVVAWGLKSSVIGCERFRSGVNVTSLVANENAFAGITSTRGVIACGAKSYGNINHNGPLSEHLASDVVSITANFGAFSALKSDGTVFTWGVASAGGGVSSVTMPALQNVVRITASHSAFAALLQNGRVVTWGEAQYGGDSSAVEMKLSKGIGFVWSSKTGFIALNHLHGVAATWGGNSNISLVDLQLNAEVVGAARTDSAVAVLREDRTVISWGAKRFGGSSTHLASRLQNITHVYGNGRAFVALNSTGGVIAWGEAVSGGKIYKNNTMLSSGVVSIVSTRQAFAALKNDGSVVTWGNAYYGGVMSNSVEAHLTSDVRLICANEVAFTAIKTNGRMVTWGNPISAGNSGAVSEIGFATNVIECK